MERDRGLCQPCLRKGRVTEAREVDHITPKHLDGRDDYDNLQAICIDCHKAKTQSEARGAKGLKPKAAYDRDGWPIW